MPTLTALSYSRTERTRHIKQALAATHLSVSLTFFTHNRLSCKLCAHFARLLLLATALGPSANQI